MLWNWRQTCQSEGSKWRCCLWGRCKAQPENPLLPATWPSVLKQGCVPHREYAKKYLKCKESVLQGWGPRDRHSQGMGLPGPILSQELCSMEGMHPPHCPYYTDLMPLVLRASQPAVAEESATSPSAQNWSLLG